MATRNKGADAKATQRAMLEKAFRNGRISEAQYRVQMQSFGLTTVAPEQKTGEVDTRPIDEQCFASGVCPTEWPPDDLARPWHAAVVLIMRGDAAGQRLADELRADEMDRYVAAKAAGR
jgi:hypothetical protein